MQQPAKLNYKVYQGSTFQETYRWESQTKVYVPITAISKAAPCVITTSTNSNIPVGWRFRVTGVQGMKEINHTDTDSYYLATGVSGTEVTINQVNSTLYTTYTSGGILEYNQPVDLTVYSARMQIRESVDSTTILHEATSANGQIVLDKVTNKTITITIPASTTQSFTFDTAVYSVELFDGISGIVVPFLVGNLTLVKEITR
jgi:hypothetical protein